MSFIQLQLKIIAHAVQLMITMGDTERDESAVPQVLIKSEDFSHSLSLCVCVCMCVWACFTISVGSKNWD